MAQTLIGNLVLRLQEEVSAKAKKAADALNNIDKAAKNVGKSGSGANKLKADMEGLSDALKKLGDAPWGAKLQAQFDRLGASSSKLAQLREEFFKLQNDLKDVGGNLKKNAFAQWRVGALADLAAVQAKMRDAERSARDLARAQEKAARDAARAAERAARDTQRAAEQAAKAQERAARQAQIAAERAARAQERASQQAARAQERAARDAERAAQRMARAQEQQANALMRGAGNAMKPVYTAAGLGTGSYVTGRLGRAGIMANSSVERERFRLEASGFDKGQAKEIEDAAASLAKKYGLFTGDIMESLREASLAFPNFRDKETGKVIKTGHQSAMEMAETITQFRATIGNILGDEKSTDLTRSMLKSFDLLGITDPGVMKKSMDEFVKMNRIIGKDVDPGQLFLATKYLRAAGKAFDPSFIYGFLPALIGESNGSDVGNSLRAMFTATVGNRRSKRSTKSMAEYGLLDDKGNVKGAALMKNPVDWIEQILKPALVDKKIDVNDNLKVASILSEIFDNRLSADVAQKILEQIPQYRDTQAKAANAQGLDSADQIRQRDPFAAYTAFTDALKNLAASANIMGVISPALNSLADGINALGGALRGMSEADLATAGIVGGLVALKGALAIGGGLTALIGAGPALMGSAAALNSAAVALGGRGVAGSVAGTAAGTAAGATTGAAAGAGIMATLKEAGSKFLPLAVVGGVLAAAMNQAQEIANADREAKSGPGYDGIVARRSRFERDQKARWESNRAAYAAAGLDETGTRMVKPGEIASTGKRDSNASTFSAPAAPAVDTSKMDEAKAKSAETGQAIQTNLNVTATPNIVTTGFDAALQKAQQLLALIGQINSSASSVGAGIGSRVRGAQSDFGVSP